MIDYHILAGLAAGALQIGIAAPYVRDMVRGTTRPNIVSWFLWDLAVGISLAAQIAAGPTWSVTVVGSAFIMDTTILVVALMGYGYKKFAWWDGACLLSSLVAIGLWIITSNPLLALAFAITADAIAFIPTFIKSYLEPYSETAGVWLALVAVALLGIVATTSFDFANLAFPIYYGIARGSLWLLILARRRMI